MKWGPYTTLPVPTSTPLSTLPCTLALAPSPGLIGLLVQQLVQSQPVPLVLAPAESPIWSLKTLTGSCLLGGFRVLILAFLRDSGKKPFSWVCPTGQPNPPAPASSLLPGTCIC